MLNVNAESLKNPKDENYSNNNNKYLYFNHTNLLTKEEAILKNESSENSYLILEPGKVHIFPNYLIGNIKCYFIIDKEKYIGEGIGFLIGNDILLTSAHNLIFSKELNETSEILNYKPYKITFNILSNGSMNLIKPIDCDADNFIFPKKLKNLVFEKNEIIHNEEYNNKSFKKQSFNLISHINENDNDDNDKNPYLNFELNNDNKSKSTNSSPIKNIQNINTNKNQRKKSINNVSEIPLMDDYAIIFLEKEIGKEIISLFFNVFNSKNSTVKALNSIDETTGLFNIIEEHINFIEEFQLKDNVKFKNSKISMVTGMKFNEKLTGLPQYVYGSNFNDWINKFNKNKSNKQENNYFNNKDRSVNVKMQMNFNNNNNSHTNFLNKKITEKEELEFCLLFNNNNNRNNRSNNIFKKLQLLNNQNFFINGKINLCEAKGKLCSLIYQKNKINYADFDYKKDNNIINNNKPNYEVNCVQENTPYFNKNKNNNEGENDKNNNDIKIKKNLLKNFNNFTNDNTINENAADICNNNKLKINKKIIYNLSTPPLEELEIDTQKQIASILNIKKDIFNENLYKRKYTIFSKYQNQKNKLSK